MSLTMFQDDGSPCKFVTDARAAIAAVDEEIEILEDYRAGCISMTSEHAAVTRILKSRQAHRADMVRWMRIQHYLEAHRAELAKGVKA